MTTETQEDVQPVEQSVVDAYNRARDQQSPAKGTPKPEITEPEAEKETTSEDATPAEVTAEPSDIEKLRQEMMQQNELTVQKLTGKIGELNRTIQQLSAKPEPASAETHTVSASAFKRLSDEFGEELAVALAEDISQLPIGQKVDMDDVVKRVSASFEAKTEKDKLEVILDEHEDFFDVRESPQFKQWRDTQPKEFQQRLAGSENPFFIIRTLTRYKDEMKRVADSSAAKQKRLEAAVTPKGVPGTTSSILPDEAGVAVGYNRRRQR